MRNRVRLVVGLFHRLAYATALAFLSWALAVFPFGAHPGMQKAAAYALNLPLALVWAVLPDSCSGVDLIFGSNFGEFLRYDEVLRLHLRAAIPVYLMLSYLPAMLRAGLNWSRRRRQPKAPLTAFAILLLLVAPGFAADRGPSTPDERQEAVRLIHALEGDPLSKDAQKARQWLVFWLAEIPDISVSMCTDLLGKHFESKQKYAPELATQQAFSGAAFMIEHPDHAQDQVAVSLAGVEGVLRTYEALLAQKPKARFATLDALLQAKSKGELEGVVKENMKSCS